MKNHLLEKLHPNSTGGTLLKIFRITKNLTSSFIIYLLGIAYVDVVLYNLGQILKWLTCKKNSTTYILDLREY